MWSADDSFREADDSGTCSDALATSSTELQHLESNARYYARIYPTRFASAKGALVRDVHGREYVDFFAGAGALNYGHNHPDMIGATIRYLRRGGILHSLDMDTEARAEFMAKFERTVLQPRGLEYRMQLTGPTGANCVEAALKLARKLTRRTTVVAFTGAFHGVSLGALAISASAEKRRAFQDTLQHVVRMPYEGYFGQSACVDAEADWLERLLCGSGSGIEPPAAFILETVQAEGGLNVASRRWAQRVAALARALGALLIVDEIQTGCGRVEHFFGFEALGLRPDLICLSKSLSGLGTPCAALLMRPSLDVWEPGEHNGTFRGNNLAFVGGSVALDLWRSQTFLSRVQATQTGLSQRLSALAGTLGNAVCELRGRGRLLGLAFREPEHARATRDACFQRGLLIETCGSRDEVCKIAPPLNIRPDHLTRGLDILEECAARVVTDRTGAGSKTKPPSNQRTVP